MAIVGSIVAHFVYRAIAEKQQSHPRAGRGPLRWPGYAAINVAAFLAACELGIQPLFFKDAAGAPLYAPYSLHIAIPAMMLGHLTFAGLAELLVSGGVVAYLQRSNPSLLGRNLQMESRLTNGSDCRPLPVRLEDNPGRSGFAWLC